MTHFSDGIRVGLAPLVGLSRAGLQGANQFQGGISKISTNSLPPWGKGVSTGFPQYAYSIVPLTIQAASIAASQTPGAAGNLVLTAGTGTTSQVIGGTTYIMLDVARNIGVTTAGSESGVNMTVSGIDWWYQKQTATVALPASATVAFSTKTFLGISSIAIDAATSLAITVGTGDTFGLVYVCGDKTLLIPKWNNTLAIDAGTMTVADATTPATAATGDVRGTYKPSSGASDGVKRLTIWQTVINPDTDSGMVGVVPA